MPLAPAQTHTEEKPASAPNAKDKLPFSQISQKLGLKTLHFMEIASEQGFLVRDGANYFLSLQGEKVSIEFVAKSRFGPYFLWPHDFYLV